MKETTATSTSAGLAVDPELLTSDPEALKKALIAQGWDTVMNQLAMMFPDRLRPEVVEAL